MKKSIFFIMLLEMFCIVLSGCAEFKQNSNPVKNEWIYNAKLDDFIDLEIERIIICTPDDDDVPDNWTALFEIYDPNKINKSVEVLRKSHRGIMPAWLEKMKIITKHKKFIMHFDWNDEIAYGDHWVSKEFRSLLRQWGLSEPK